MKHCFLLFLSVLLCAGCHTERIRLNNEIVRFDNFPLTDSLNFSFVSDSIWDEPSELLFNGTNLIINNFNRAKDDFVSVYSLSANRIVKEFAAAGSGPEEYINCDLCLLDDKLWLYDMGKMRIGSVPVDSLLCDSLHIVQYKLPNYYYRVAMLNDSVLLATNDLVTNKKITYVNLKDGEITAHGDYAFLDEKIDLGTLIDACSCYIDVNPQSKDIVLSYRYTDVIEIYDSEGNLKHSVQGPDCFDIEFRTGGTPGMRKTKKTRKAFVNSYVTANYIYLLYSGCNRTEKNWAYGTQLYVYSWDGKPQKCYLLDQPVYAFAVDEERQLVYSYSLQNEELIKAAM